MDVVLARCSNPECPSKKPLPHLGPEFEKPAEKVLGTVSRRLRGDGTPALPIVRCGWCSEQATPLEEVVP